MRPLPPNRSPPPSAPPAPIAESGAACSRRPTDRGGAAIAGDPDASGEFRQTVLQGRGARRDAGARRAPAAPDAAGTTGRSRASTGTRRSTARADGFKRIVERHGPDAVAFYLSGQLLTEDYYVANKLMKGFIGSANVDTNSRLCMASSVAGHKRAFGADTVPGLYEDLDQADLIVLVGSNAAWCHPVLFQRMQENRRERGAKLVVIDPRRTATAEEADLHLAIKPGMDTALFCGLLVRLADRDAFDRALRRRPHDRLRGGAAARAREIAPDVAAVARTTGLDAADVRALLRPVRRDRARRHLLFAGREPVGAGHRQGQRDHQLPSRHRAASASPAWGRSR